MSSPAYYNEIDPYAAKWLRRLIAANLIAPGDVDERDIRDVRPSDLRGYRQCHFFAGIGGWSYALRLAGWPDDRCVWTGSCPCQPFSQAGKGDGFADERHLWPAWQWLIAQCLPSRVYGEQVAAGQAICEWIDLVASDLEGLDYAFAPMDLPAACVGAPHRRQRVWWVADGNERGRSQFSEARLRLRESWDDVDGRGELGQLVDAGRSRLEIGPFADVGCGTIWDEGAAVAEGRLLGGERSASAVHGGWHGADWLRCRDGRWRPVEPGTFPLAHGISDRVGRLRAYGNAIVPQVAAAFIATSDEALSQVRSAA
jgi:DNA (cytosine-5)-methyltransferase 1